MSSALLIEKSQHQGTQLRRWNSWTNVGSSNCALMWFLIGGCLKRVLKPKHVPAYYWCSIQTCCEAGLKTTYKMNDSYEPGIRPWRTVNVDYFKISSWHLGGTSLSSCTFNSLLRDKYLSHEPHYSPQSCKKPKQLQSDDIRRRLYERTGTTRIARLL